MKALTRTTWGAVKLASLVAGAAFVLPAWGQEAQDEVVYQKHQVEVFDDDTIDGNLSSPDGQYIRSLKEQKHRRLIRVRQDFRDEILHSLRVL